MDEKELLRRLDARRKGAPKVSRVYVDIGLLIKGPIEVTREDDNEIVLSEYTETGKSFYLSLKFDEAERIAREMLSLIEQDALASSTMEE